MKGYFLLTLSLWSPSPQSPTFGAPEGWGLSLYFTWYPSGCYPLVTWLYLYLRLLSNHIFSPYLCFELPRLICADSYSPYPLEWLVDILDVTRPKLNRSSRINLFLLQFSVSQQMVAASPQSPRSKTSVIPTPRLFTTSILSAAPLCCTCSSYLESSPAATRLGQAVTIYI